MRNVFETLVIALNAAASAAGAAPEWLQLVPAGTFSGEDGRGPFVNDRPEDVVALFAREGRKLPVDENHSTELAPRTGAPSPARGWIVAMEVRDGSIWGRVEWNEAGAAMMADNAYGFLSPVFLHPAKPPYRVTKLTSVALTNNPNLTQLKSLHAQQETEMLEQLRKLLGLPETADEATVMAAAASMHSAFASQAALMTAIATAAGQPAATGDALVSAVQAAVAKPANAEGEIAALKGEVKALHNQLSAYVSTTSQDKAATVIDQAIKDGKVIPVLRDHYIARHVKDAADVEREISMLPSLHAGGLGNRQPPKPGAEPDADEMAVAAMMGVDPAAYAETYKKLFGKGV
jgi:phage I-like protein